MALSGTVITTARLAGTALGGVAVALLALQGVVLVAVVGYLAVLLLVWSVRVPEASPPEKAGRPQRTLALARRTPGVLPLLLSVGLLAGSVLPVLSLLLPLAARERTWTAGQTGLVEAAWLVGTLAVSLLVARLGTWPSARGPLVAGPAITAAGTAMIAWAASPVVAVGGAVVLGIGTAIFTSHAMPHGARVGPPALAEGHSCVGESPQHEPGLDREKERGCLPVESATEKTDTEQRQSQDSAKEETGAGCH